MSKYLVKFNECDEYPGLYHIEEFDSLEELLNTVSYPHIVPVYEQIGFIKMKPEFVDGFEEENSIKLTEEENSIKRTRTVIRLSDPVPRNAKYHLSYVDVDGETYCGKRLGIFDSENSDNIAESEMCKNCIRSWNSCTSIKLKFGDPLLIAR